MNAPQAGIEPSRSDRPIGQAVAQDSAAAESHTTKRTGASSPRSTEARSGPPVAQERNPAIGGTKAITRILCVLVLCCRGAAYAGETDQYLAWEAEIEDCSGVINTHLNEELGNFIDRANNEYTRLDTERKFTNAFFYHQFSGLHHSRLKRWIKNTDLVDTFPPRDLGNLSHQRSSIYRGLAFPFVLPMSRTININGIHLGIDKIMHMFGFGRRYYKNYHGYLDNGLSEEAALEKMIRRGWFHERFFVGGLVDGIVSYADLEANFQGFRLASDLCAGTRPHVVRREGKWLQVRAIDLREYVTPEFDESYYPSHFQGLRRRLVNKVLDERYTLEAPPPMAAARFRRYNTMAPSYSTELIARIRSMGNSDPPEQHAWRRE